MSTSLRVCTYNIRFILDRYDERRELLENVIESVDADVYGFQEVLVGGQMVGQQKDIVRRLNRRDYRRSYDHFDCEGFRLYTALLPLGLTHLFHNPIADIFYDLWALFNTYFLCAITGPYTQFLYHHDILKVIVYFILGTCWVFGTSQVVDRAAGTQQVNDAGREQEQAQEQALALPPVRHHVVRVGGFRGVGFVDLSRRVQTPEGPRLRRIMLVNVHLSSAPHEEDFRVDEAHQIMSWLKEQATADAKASRPPVDAVVVSGDFNCRPDGPCYSFFKEQGFLSAHCEAHGSEPSVTFHQQHSAPTKDVSDECCLDYIMFRGDCLRLPGAKGGKGRDAGSVRLIGTQCSPFDPTLYPSDHFGIVVDFEVV
jgi:endonuclease/exonuclease/phosphatase family metal-dependent hydrolase